jgi:hypothetical protein
MSSNTRMSRRKSVDLLVPCWFAYFHPCAITGRQDRLGSDFSPADMAALTERENEGKRKYAEVSAEASALSKELASLTAEPTDGELDSELARLQAEADGKQAKVGSLSGAKPADPKQRAKVLADFKKLRTAWVERKRKATDFLEVMTENMNKKMKDVVVRNTQHRSTKVSSHGHLTFSCVIVAGADGPRDGRGGGGEAARFVVGEPARDGVPLPLLPCC